MIGYIYNVNDRYSSLSFPNLIFALIYISIWVGTLSMIPKEGVHVICCVFGAVVGWPDILTASVGGWGEGNYEGLFLTPTYTQ